MRTGFRVWFWAVLCIFLFSASGSATILKRFTLSSLTQAADFVVVGRIQSVETVMVHGEPWTQVRVTVEKQLKGSTFSSIVFRVPGGTHSVNGKLLVTRVEGVPLISGSEKVVLFLQGSSPSIPHLVGWEQGYWTVKSDMGREVASSNSFEPVDFARLLQEINRCVKEK